MTTKKPAQTKRPVGRPPGKEPIPQESAEIILNSLFEGRSLTSILAEVGVHPSTVWRWTQKDQDFAQRFQRAMRFGAVVSVETGIDKLDSATPETANLARYQADYRMRRAAFVAPDVFGTKIKVDSNSKVEHSGEVTVSHQQLDTDSRQKWLRQFRSMASAELGDDDASRN